MFSWPGGLSDHGDPVCPSMAGRAGSCPARSWCEAFSGVLGTVSRSISHKLLEVDWKCAELLGLGRPVSHGVPPWPVLLNIFIHDLGDGEESTLSELVDGPEPGGVVIHQRDRAAIQGDLGRLEKWAEEPHGVQPGECQVLSWERNNPRPWYLLESSSEEKVLAVPLGRNLSKHQARGLVAWGLQTLGRTGQSTESGSGEERSSCPSARLC